MFFLLVTVTKVSGYLLSSFMGFESFSVLRTMILRFSTELVVADDNASKSIANS